MALARGNMSTVISKILDWKAEQRKQNQDPKVYKVPDEDVGKFSEELLARIIPFCKNYHWARKSGGLEHAIDRYKIDGDITALKQWFQTSRPLIFGLELQLENPTYFNPPNWAIV